MKNLLEQLLHICNELNDENEIAIINEYGCNGKHYTVGLTGKKIFLVCIIIYIFSYLFIYILICKMPLLKNHIRQVIIIFLCTE